MRANLLEQQKIKAKDKQENTEKYNIYLVQTFRTFKNSLTQAIKITGKSEGALKVQRLYVEQKHVAKHNVTCNSSNIIYCI